MERELTVLNSSEVEVGKLTIEETFVYNVFMDMQSVTKSFFKIGFRLGEAGQKGYHKRLLNGKYDNIADFAEGVFGIKKTMAYDLIKVAVMFRSRSCAMEIADEYKGYNQSQLIEMSRMYRGERAYVQPTDTVAELRELRKMVGRYGEYPIRNVKTTKEALAIYAEEESKRKNVSLKDEGEEDFVQVSPEEVSVYTERQEEEVSVRPEIEETEEEEIEEENSVRTETEFVEESSVETENQPVEEENSVRTEKYSNYKESSEGMYYVAVFMNGRVEDFCSCPTRVEALKAVERIHELYLRDFSADKFSIVMTKDGVLLRTEE